MIELREATRRQGGAIDLIIANLAFRRSDGAPDTCSDYGGGQADDFAQPRCRTGTDSLTGFDKRQYPGCGR